MNNEPIDDFIFHKKQIKKIIKAKYNKINLKKRKYQKELLNLILFGIDRVNKIFVIKNKLSNNKLKKLSFYLRFNIPELDIFTRKGFIFIYNKGFSEINDFVLNLKKNPKYCFHKVNFINIKKESLINFKRNDLYQISPDNITFLLCLTSKNIKLFRNYIYLY